MLIEITYNRKSQKAEIRTIYNIVMFESGITSIEEKKEEIENCRISHTGESIAFVKASAGNEIQISSPDVLGIYPKAMTVVTYKD